jgi:hypothetical protein
MADHAHGASHGHPSGGHENKDIKIRGILVSMVVLALSIVAVELLMGLWMAVYVRRDHELSRQAPPAELRFPSPELQGNPGADMKKFLAVEGQSLDGYGWHDEKAHIARLPIARGIDTVLAHGLPVHKTETPAPAPLTPPTEPSSAEPSSLKQETPK